MVVLLAYRFEKKKKIILNVKGSLLAFSKSKHFLISVQAENVFYKIIIQFDCFYNLIIHFDFVKFLVRNGLV